MRNTPLWRDVGPLIPVRDRVRILQALELAATTTAVDTNATRISDAMVWGNTPQGHAFWMDIAVATEAARARRARPQVQVDTPIQAQPRARARAQVAPPEAKKSNIVRIPAD